MSTCSLLRSPPSCTENLSRFNGSWATADIPPAPHASVLPSLGLEADSLLLSTRLLLTGEFEEEEMGSPLKLYLTNTEIVVASKCSVGADAPGILKPRLEHVRTHYLNDTVFQRGGDTANQSNMTVKTKDGSLFRYKPKRDDQLELWLDNISHLQITRSAPPKRRDSLSQMEFSLSTQLPLLQSPPALTIHRPSREWHGESFRYQSVSPDSPSLLSASNSCHHQPTKSSSLKRREAFRVQDLARFRFSKARSSSAPPEESTDTGDHTLRGTSSPQSPLSDNNLRSSPTTATAASPDSTNTKSKKMISSSAPSSLRKKKLIKSHARKFTRALSARIMNTNIPFSSVHLSPKPSKKQIERGRSFNTEFSSASSASLPRSLPNKYVKKTRSSMYPSNTTTPEPVIPPVTPTRLKSPGNFLRLLRKRGSLLATQGSFDDQTDGPGLELTGEREWDLFNKPAQFKLYLQNPKEVAEQLALTDSDLFRGIDLSELKNEAWTKKSKQATSPNVIKMIESFNHLARVVCTEIVHERSVHVRAKAISSYIQLAGRCYRVHNYNSMKAIISGLQSQAIYRLSRTWNHVPSRRRKKFEKLSRLCSDLENSELLQKEMFINLQNGVQCVPYLGWLLTNIVHWQTYNRLHKASDISFRRRSASFSEKRGKWRESTCSVSMPTSPTELIREETSTGSELGSQDIIVRKSLSRSLCNIPAHEISDHAYSIDHSTPVKPLVHPLSLSGECSLHLNGDRDHLGISTATKRSLNHSLARQRNESVSDSSNDDHSMKTDSAIGLDSSMSHTSPERTLIRKSESHSTKTGSLDLLEEYSLPTIDSNFDSDSDDDDDDQTHQTSFAETIASSSSSSSLILSPSLVTLSLEKQRRVTLAQIPVPHPLPINSEVRVRQAPTIYFDFGCGGLLFSSCSLPEEEGTFPNSETSDRLTAVVEQLILSRNEEIDEVQTVSSDTVLLLEEITPVLELDSSSVNPELSTLSEGSTIDKHVSPNNNNVPLVNSEGREREDNSVFTLFKRYQFNTFNYLTEYSTNQRIKRLITDTPCCNDDKECHCISLEIEPPLS